MSFSAAAKRARDESRPICQRVTALHSCLVVFNLFGFDATRLRLRATVGVSGATWTSAQVVEAMDLLEAAKRSWSAFARQEEERRRREKKQHRNSRPRPADAAYAEWFNGYLRGDAAAAWLVAHLGDCADCGHRLVHHGAHACRACVRDPACRPACRVPLPPP